MTVTLKRNYLKKVIKDANMRRRQVVAMKSDATKKFYKGLITEELRNLAHNRSDELQKDIKDYIKYSKFKSKTIKGYGFLMMQKKC